MKHSLLIVDDFYDNPDDVRARALSLSYQRVEGVNYPGVMAATTDDIRPTLEHFSRLLGNIDIRCRRNEGTFRVTTECDMAIRKSLVHIDTTDFTAIVHLSKTNNEGTYFYRHKALNLERVSPKDNFSAIVHQAIEADTLNLDAWEMLYSIPMKYNRLIIFDGKCFHSGAINLTGSNILEGRMTQNFFFNVSLV
jgi:hypothetical protein